MLLLIARWLSPQSCLAIFKLRARVDLSFTGRYGIAIKYIINTNSSKLEKVCETMLLANIKNEPYLALKFFNPEIKKNRKKMLCIYCFCGNCAFKTLKNFSVIENLYEIELTLDFGTWIFSLKKSDQPFE